MRTGTSRSSGRAAWRWHFGLACFDEASLGLTVAGQAVELERRPLELLALLLSHAGEVVTKGEIVAALWLGREVSDASLTKCVARLRRAIGDIDHSIIVTVHGYGYRFAASVTVEEASGGPAPPPNVATLAAGDAVPGRPGWRLLYKLGSGGFGDSWLAEHRVSGEKHAVKFAANETGVAALRREVILTRLLREALGRREDLVHALDWNLEQPPFFLETGWSTMGSLVDWAAAQGGIHTLDMQTRIDLTAQIADALAAVHSVGVLHKDLKPANVLLRALPTGGLGIILTDFGSGRAIDTARLDALGITHPEVSSGGTGTQIYQAPELASGSLGTVQADIFALGVILFQMITGDLKRPLAPGWEEEVADPLLRQDIARAAAGDPARRLTSAAELAASLRALPARREAAAASAAQAAEAARLRRTLEASRARRGPLRALAAVLLGGLALTSYLTLRAEQAERAAQTEASRANSVTGFLTDDLFSAANPVLGANPNMPIKAVLATASSDLDRKFRRGSLDRAAIEAAIGSAYAGLADPEHALPLLRAALATDVAQLGPASPQAQSIRLAMADLTERMADLPALRKIGQEIMANHPADTDTELRGRFAVIYADCLDADTDSACIVKLRPFLDEVTRRTGDASLLALRVDDLLAYQLAEGQRFTEAIPLARRTVALSQTLFGPDSLHAQERRFHLGLVLTEAGQQTEAISLLVDVQARLLAISGVPTELSNRVATQLARAYAADRQYDKALPLLRATLAYNERTHGEGFEFTRHGINLLAKTLAAAGHAEEAIPLGERALALQRAAQGADNEDTLWIEGNLAEEYRAAGNLARAESIYTDVITRARGVFTHGEWDTGHFEMLLGQVLAAEGKNARPVLADSISVLSKALGETDQRTKEARAMLARIK